MKKTQPAKPRARQLRSRQSMPAPIRRALVEARLMEAYRDRPAYQRNDYLGWMAGAKRDATRKRRLQQMLRELEKGNVYMNMAWRPTQGRAAERPR